MQTSVLMAASASLLMLPGPTNALLAAAGAAMGGQKAWPLLVGVVGGYGAAILTLRAAVGPAIAASPALDIALRILVMSYLLMLASRMWRQGCSEHLTAGPMSISLRDITFTTLLNPKSIIFAFAILPERQSTLEDLALMLPLAVLMAASGALWIMIGAALRRGVSHRITPGLGYRACAVVLVLIAGTLTSQAFV